MLGKRDLWLARQSASDALYFIFATSRIHKKHVKLGHADGCRGNKQVNSNRSHICDQCASCICKKHFRGPLAFGGPRQSPIFA